MSKKSKHINNIRVFYNTRGDKFIVSLFKDNSVRLLWKPIESKKMEYEDYPNADDKFAEDRIKEKISEGYKLSRNR